MGSRGFCGVGSITPSMIFTGVPLDEKALEWYYKALAIREKVLGAEHPSTAATYANIQEVLLRLGKSDST